jgi:hypothetical protein
MATNPQMIVRIAANLQELKRNLAEGKLSIETTTAGMQKLAASLDGSKLEQRAHNITAAIHQVGGASRLTDVEAQRLKRTLDEYVDKATRMGREVPPAILAQRDALARTNTEGINWMATLRSVAGLMGVAFGVNAIKGWITSTVDAASRIDDLTRKLGVSAEAIQRWTYAGEQNGLTIENIQTAVSFMNKTLGEGDKSTIAVLKKAGLEFDAIRAMRPEDAFNTIVEAIEGIDDPMTRAELAMRMFSRSGQDLLPAIMEGFRATGDAASVMSAETIKALDAAGDHWTAFWNRIKVGSGETIGWLLRMETVINGLKNPVQTLRGLFDETAPRAKAPALPGRGEIETPEFDMDALLKRSSEMTKGLESDLKRLGDQRLKDAEAVRKQIESMTGLEAITKGLNTAQLLNRMTTEQQTAALTVSQASIHKSMTDAIAAYRALGQEVPPTIQRIANETRDLGFLTAKVGLVDLKAFKDGFDALPKVAVPSLAQIQSGLNATDEEIELVMYHLGQFIEELYGVAEASDSLSTRMKAGLIRTLERIPDILVQAMTGGGGMKGALKAIGSMIGSELGEIIGESLGKKFGETAGKWGGLIGKALGSLAGPALGWLYDKLFGTTDYEKRVRANAEAVKQITTEAIAAAGGMDKLRDRAALVGIQIDAAFASRDAKWIEQVLGNVEERTQRLTAAMEKYGISWEDLGERARQSKINQIAEDLILDFEVLMSAGADVNFIIERMGDSILEFVAMAARTGTEVPAAMRPMLQRMLDMGLLVDENGEAFGSLEESGIKFAETMTAGFDRIVDAINRIAAALGYVFSEFDGRSINIGTTYSGGTAPSPQDRGTNGPEIHAATGFSGWINKPTRFLAGEAGPEHIQITQAGQGGDQGGYAPLTVVVEGEALIRTFVKVARARGLN